MTVEDHYEDEEQEQDQMQLDPFTLRAIAEGRIKDPRIKEDKPTPISFTPPPPPELEGISRQVLSAIGKYILEGLNEKEACILAGLDYQDIESLNDNPQYKLYIDKVKIKFKHQHMKRISQQGDGKTSQWLIDRNTPKDVKEESTNPIALIIREVQMSTDSPVVIHEIHATKEHRTEELAQRLKGSSNTTGSSNSII